ncbi:MAG: DNA methyltransferase [Chloroflexota bacterium]|nr:DNA methyltransferase [Chloroflexota bacterium]
MVGRTGLPSRGEESPSTPESPIFGSETEASDRTGGENLRRLKALLAELFMFDHADLDFGIYRIMKLRREEIRRFLDEDLLPQVRDALDQLASGERAATERELLEAEAGARKLGMDPDDSPIVRELRDKYKAIPDIAVTEEEVYSHLVTFFRRYYKEGDFISMRRYKDGVYAIPYEGEEVKLHWANADQFYVKTAEHFREYTFLLADSRRVHFKLVEASTEANNNRAQNGKDRRFILTNENPVIEQDGALVVRFEYRLDPDSRNRDVINDDSIHHILNDPATAAWREVLGQGEWPDDAQEPTSVLRRHLNKYTAKNEFDYFIHKDLGDFLRRELAFYLKNDVMHLDDIDQDGRSALEVERYLDKVRAIRRVGHKIIDLLAQLEDFQKRLWLKKKFVVETHWCITLDRVPEELYGAIVANESQRKEWVKLFAINEFADDMVTPAYSEPLTTDFLHANPHLVVDTSLFEHEFVERLLASIDDLDANTDGLLIHSENFQALSLLRPRYRERINTIYIDPPYNSPSTRILYKNDYAHSSWLSLINDRLRCSSALAANQAPHIIAVDDNEAFPFALALKGIWPTADISAVSIVHNPRGVQGDNFKYSHEYCFFVIPESAKVVRPRSIPESEWEYTPLRNWGGESDREDGGPNTFYPIFIRGNDILGVGEAAEEHWHPSGAQINRDDGTIEVWPIDSNGREKKWRYARENVARMLECEPERLRVESAQGNPQVRIAKVADNPKTVWVGPQFDAGTHGTRLLTTMLGTSAKFTYPKSLHQVRECIDVVSDKRAVILDYFAGSGTTAHATINLNREDDGQRKYILVEMGDSSIPC